MAGVTIRTVAKVAGVSVSTVSNVLNGRYNQMAEDTRLRVLDAIKRLEYRPNGLAKGLATSRSATIGLVISDITNPLYPPVVKGVETRCNAAGYSVLLASASDTDAERRAVEVMCSRRVDGLIFFSVSALNVDNAHVLKVAAEGLSVVAINRFLGGVDALSQVRFDHRAGARLATEHLLQLGHTAIACVGGPSGRFTAVERLAGYREALARWGVPYDERLVTEGDYSFESGRRLAKRLLAHRPTAFFVAGDAMALGTLRAILESGLRVPEDVSLVAFGNPDSVRYATPPLTTVDLPVVRAGRAAADLLIRQIRGHLKRPECIVLPSRLLVRGSSAPLAGAARQPGIGRDA